MGRKESNQTKENKCLDSLLYTPEKINDERKTTVREKIIFRLIAPSILSPTSLGNYQCEEICQCVKICNDEKNTNTFFKP